MSSDEYWAITWNAFHGLEWWRWVRGPEGVQ